MTILNLFMTEGHSAESSKNLLGRHLAAGFNLSDNNIPLKISYFFELQ
jgi:hypothetical protein